MCAFPDCGSRTSPRTGAPATQIVVLQGHNRRRNHPTVSLTFLGYTFRPRAARDRHGAAFCAFLPAISQHALKKISTQLRRWRLHRKIFKATDGFKHAACKRTLKRLAHFVWWRVIRWLRALHRWTWKDVRRAFTTPNGRWRPITVDGIELFNLTSVPVTRYRYRANTIPNPWTLPTSA